MLGGCIEKPGTHLRDIKIMADIITTKERYNNDPVYRERILSNKRKCRDKHGESIRATEKKRRDKNKEHLQITHKQWREEHPERSHEIKRQWHNKNRSKINARKATRYATSKQDPVSRMIATQRSRLYISLKRKNLSKNEPTIAIIGCSAIRLKEYLASKFQEGMTWDNHGVYGWHVDHIKPLASFDFNDPEQIKQAFHYTNLQPLWWCENLKKGSRVA